MQGELKTLHEEQSKRSTTIVLLTAPTPDQLDFELNFLSSEARVTTMVVTMAVTMAISAMQSGELQC